MPSDGVELLLPLLPLLPLLFRRIDWARSPLTLTPWRHSCRYSLLEVWPATGRTHQIRAHMAHLGFPLVRDAIYQDSRAKRESHQQQEHVWCKSLFLHSHKVINRPLRFGVF